MHGFGCKAEVVTVAGGSPFRERIHLMLESGVLSVHRPWLVGRLSNALALEVGGYPSWLFMCHQPTVTDRVCPYYRPVYYPLDPASRHVVNGSSDRALRVDHTRAVLGSLSHSVRVFMADRHRRWQSSLSPRARKVQAPVDSFCQ